MRAGLVRALRRYYSGMGFNESFADDTTPSKSSYYRLKGEYPSDIEVIEEEARQLALRDRDKEITAFDGELLDASVRIRRAATEGIEEIVPDLIAIAKGAVFTAKLRNSDGEEYERDIYCYPRDRVDAARLLMQVAQQGVVPELKARELVDDRVHGGTSSFPVLGTPVDFTEVKLTKPDGETITVSRSSDGDVIDGETVELD